MSKTKIFTYWSVVGGTGKTTIATNSAIRLAMTNPDKKIALLDFNPINADVDIHLGLKGKDLKETLVLFANNNANITKLDNFLMKYKKVNNLYVLQGLYDFAFFDKFNKNHFQTIIDYLKSLDFDYIIIDVNYALFIDSTFISIATSDKLVVVLEPIKSVIRDTDNCINGFITKKLGLTNDRIVYLVNKFENNLLDKEVIKEMLETENIFYISENKKVKQCINNSEPFALFLKGKITSSLINELDLLLNNIIEDVNTSDNN